MDSESEIEEAVELLKQMGLKEYEARCFVALTRLSGGTAKEVSEVSDVPRTRVYDAVRVLETEGLVEVQHSNPRVFRAISVGEAVDTLLDRFESKTEKLGETLRGLGSATPDEDAEVRHEVWTLADGRAIANRTYRLIDDADREVALVVDSEAFKDGKLVESLSSALDRGVEVFVGTAEEDLRDDIRENLPEAEVFVSHVEALTDPSNFPEDDTRITRMVLIDGETFLVSSFRDTGGGGSDEHAVFGKGFNNGLVALMRRLVSDSLQTVSDD